MLLVAVVIPAPARAIAAVSAVVVILISPTKHRMANRAKIRIKKVAVVQEHRSRRGRQPQHSQQLRIATKMAMLMARKRAVIR